MSLPTLPGGWTSPAVQRNRVPILEALRPQMPETGGVLEIAAGSGEHSVFLAQALPGLAWQPTDGDPAAVASISAWREAMGPANLLPPRVLDVTEPQDWPVEPVDAVVCINMIHISPWIATEGLMAGAEQVLMAGGLLYLYGPYRERGRATAPSNEAFDLSLRTRDPSWGLRELEEVVTLAAHHAMRFEDRIEMPANNLSLIFRRE